MTQYLNEARARRALAKNLSPRFLRLDRLERYVVGTQYAGRQPFWDSDTPVYDRAPCVVYPIVQSAIRSNVDLCLGDNRFPHLTSFVDEDDTVFDDEQGLSEDDSELLDRWLEVAGDQARLQSVCRELLSQAQSCGTAVAICSIRNGRVRIDTTRAKWCTPKFDASFPDEVESLEIQYPYLQEYYDEVAQRWGLRCMLYRRLIDEESDVTFFPIEADDTGRKPAESSWKRDDSKSLDHGLGFCPVVWYKHLPECTTVDEIDGTAIHVHLTDEIDALNVALSQKYVASLVAASPPTIEIGVDEDHEPGQLGRTAQSLWLPTSYTDWAAMPADDPANRQWQFQGGAQRPARKRGPGIVWRYPNPDSKVEQLVLPGDALKTIEEVCQDLRAKIAEALSVVFTDLQTQRSQLDISGRALREQHKRQIERCDIIRDDFGDNLILRLVDIIARLVLKTPVEKLRIPGVAKVLPLLKRFIVQVEDETGETGEEWAPPKLDLMWGEYFTPSEMDQKAVVDGTIAALNATIISKRSAVQRVADYYDIGNVDEYLDTLEAEAEEKQQKALENAEAMAQIQPAGAPPGQPKPNGAAKPMAPKPKPAVAS